MLGVVLTVIFFRLIIISKPICEGRITSQLVSLTRPQTTQSITLVPKLRVQGKGTLLSYVPPTHLRAKLTLQKEPKGTIPIALEVSGVITAYRKIVTVHRCH